jgi:hypothetical protein
VIIVIVNSGCLARMGKAGAIMEVISCHDCERFVSFSAVSCPHCGSIEPTGPYRLSKAQARRLGREQRNDNNLLIGTISLGVAGTLYGIAINVPSALWATIGAIFYGVLGVVAGAVISGTFNIVRNLRYFAIPIGLVLVLLAYRFGIIFRG